MAKRAALTYSPDWYSPVYLRLLLSSKDASKVRKEYTRLRDISQKRLKRMKSAGLEYSEIYKKNVNHYPKLKDIKSNNELSSRLADLARFISSQQSTVSGFKTIRQKALSTLHEHGYTFVTNENYEQFAQFMAEYRYQHLDMVYDSGEAADTFGVLEKHHIPLSKIQKDFEYWVENHKELEKMRSMKKDWDNPDALKKRLNKRKRSKKK